MFGHRSWFIVKAEVEPWQTTRLAAEPGPPDVATPAVAGIAVISAVTGIAGGATGGVVRAARNNPGVLPLATILVFVETGERQEDR